MLKRVMIGNRPAVVWLRDWRVTFIVLIWAILATLFSVRLSRQSNVMVGTPATSQESKTGSMHQLVTQKSATGAQNGLGYLYEAGKKCPYTWHGGAPDSDVRGSCWCGLDSYCMCTPSLAIDAIIEVPGSVVKNGESDQDEPYIVVVRRRDPPRDTHAIPGGFVDVGESVEAATIREVKEETNLHVARLEQFHVYSDPSRDKRRHTVSVVFRCIVEDIGSLHKGDDAKGVHLVKLTDLFKPDINLAFDHAEIFKQYARKVHPTLGVPK